MSSISKKDVKRDLQQVEKDLQEIEEVIGYLHCRKALTSSPDVSEALDQSLTTLLSQQVILLFRQFFLQGMLEE